MNFYYNYMILKLVVSLAKNILVHFVMLMMLPFYVLVFLLNLCAEYVLEYHLLFNDTKTVCISFGCIELPSRCVCLGTKPLTWVSSLKHLGNTLTNLCTDVDDIKIKTGIFISQVNTLIAKFGHLQNVIISKFKPKLNKLTLFTCYVGIHDIT